MTDMDKLADRMFEKFDRLEDKISDLCDRMTKVETKLDSHFEDIEKQQASKEKKFYYIIGVMGVLFTVYEVTKGLL